MKTITCAPRVGQGRQIGQLTRPGFWRHRHPFTLIEILIVVILIFILFAMSLSSFQKARVRAKFTRWYAFNRNCSNDAYCVINFNFQEGKDIVLNNSAQGADIKNFNYKDYNGYFWNSVLPAPTPIAMNPTSGINAYCATTTGYPTWVKSGGRWGYYKHALQFDGSNSCVVVPGTQGLDFTPLDDFTVFCWVKFDKMELGDCPFSKSLWGTSTDAAAQYDLYANNFAGSTGQGSFDVDVFTTCATWMDTDVDFNKKGWVHLVLRYEYIGLNSSGKCEGRIMTFVNGEPLGPYQETTEENPGTCTATDWKVCSTLKVPLVLGGAGCYKKYWDPGRYDKTKVGQLWNELCVKKHFKGKMDEFIVYKRALSDNEIKIQYLMGRD